MKKQFTLVEVLIAMGVCVVGVCSIMALFPVGISASRDASMAGLASNTADQLLHLAKAIIVKEENTDGKTVTEEEAVAIFQKMTGFTDIYDTSTYKKTDKPSKDAEPDDENDWQEIGTTSPLFAQLLKDYITTTGGDLAILTHTYTPPSDPTKKEIVYKVTKGQYDDLECVVRVWVEPIEVMIPTSKTGVACLPRSARFHTEVSWPAQKNYDKRQKLEYTLDMYCPKRESASSTP